MLDSPAEARRHRRANAASARIRDSGALESARSPRSSRRTPSQVALYRSGKTQTFGWFVGQVMKKTGGRADPRPCATRYRRSGARLQLESCAAGLA